MKQLTDLTADEFLERSEFACVLFYVDWSPGCQEIERSCDELQINYSNVKFGKLNVEDCAELTMEYRVRSVPTVIFTRKGQVVSKVEGLLYKDQIHDLLADLRSKR